MSKVYKVNDGKSAADQIPSIEYINELTKMIDDRFKYPNIVVSGFPSIKTNIAELPVGIKEIPEVTAKTIKTDSEHRFINEAILSTMIDKPSKFEVAESITEVEYDLKAYMDEIYTRIVNTPNVVNKLRDISTILNEDEISAGLLNALAEKINLQDFNEHVKSSIHMNNNDRKALNILIKCLTTGFDWNAEDGAFNAIKNKPESLPANGGNADTVANHNIGELINKDDYDIVVGSSLEKYSKDSCDIYAKNGFLNEVLFNNISHFKDGGIILFKRGYYTTVGDLYFNRSSITIINGVDCRLSWLNAKNIYMDNTVFKNIGFDKSKIFIKSKCEIKDAKFVNCEIVLDRLEDCTITNCIFENCKIIVNGSLMNNIIKFNRYIQTKPITYIGGNNIISENIY